MMHWTLRSMVTERLTVLASAAGIALAVLLVLYLDAVFRGEAEQIVALIDHVDADVWVLQDGVENLHMTRSRLSDDSVVTVERTDGVARSVALTYWAGLAGEPGHERAAYVVGVPEGAAGVGPWHMAEGRVDPEPGSVIVPLLLARTEGLAVGDEFRIGSSSYRISGLSYDTYSMANPLFFLTDKDARNLAGTMAGSSIVLAWADKDVSPRELADRINAGSVHINALVASELRANDWDLALQMGGALIRLMTLIATAVAALIVSFSAYAFVAEHGRELAMAKALGAMPHHLLASAVMQTVIVALLGCTLAFLAAVTLQLVLPQLIPEVAVRFSTGVAASVAGLTLLIAVAAALVPALHLLRVDPTDVFR